MRVGLVWERPSTMVFVLALEVSPFYLLSRGNVCL